MADEERQPNRGGGEEETDAAESMKIGATETEEEKVEDEVQAPATEDVLASEESAQKEAAEPATDEAVTIAVDESKEEKEEKEETVMESSETQKETTTESSHLESTVRTSTPVKVIDEEKIKTEQSEAVREQEQEEVIPDEPAPERKSEMERAETPKATEAKTEEIVGEVEEDKVTETSKSEGSAERISEPSIKAKLEDIIKEIDDSVEIEEHKEREEQQEQVDGEEQVYHTWKPKGKYEIEHTPVVVEEVVAIDVAPVPEPEPIKKPAPVAPSAEEQQKQQEQQELSLQLNESVDPIMVPQLLPNGELGSPIEIPAGIPLLARVLPPDEESSNREKIPLERLFTPATDYSGDITPKKKKAAFASSDFYAPNHPTIDDQLQLAQNISKSLGDQNNKTSRGQAMYEKRKQKSVKWIHQEGGKLVQQEFEEEIEAHSSEMNIMEMEGAQPQSKPKPAMKLVMNPKGVQDHTTVDQHYQQLMEQTNTVSGAPSGISSGGQVPASPEIVKDIINDMQSPTGKGAALFAKRKKRMDKFIVDETNVQKSSAYQQEQQSVVNNQFSSQTSSSFSSSSSTVQKKSTGPAAAPASTAAPGSKKKWLQERDQEQQQIMEDFLKNRESQFKLVKTPWEAVLETGNTSSAFQQSQSSFSSSISGSMSSASTAVQGSNVPSWLEMPKPVPVTAPVPKSGPSAPLPTPPSLFPKPAPGLQANGPHNNPTTLPDLSDILTSAPAKAKSLTSQGPSSTTKPGSLNVKPALKLDAQPSSKSPRSLSLDLKSSEKRLSTLPNTAKYPLPSYLNIASGPTGYLRSSSTSSIPSLAAFANEDVTMTSTDDLSECYPFLKPGTPPIMVVPGAVEGDPKPVDALKNADNPVTNGQVEFQNAVKENFGISLRKQKPRTTPATTENSGAVLSNESKNGIMNFVDCKIASASSTSVDLSSSIASSSQSYDFPSIVASGREPKPLYAMNDMENDASASTIQSNRFNHSNTRKVSPHSSTSFSPFVAPMACSAVEKSFSLDASNNNRDSQSVNSNIRQGFLDNECDFPPSPGYSVNNMRNEKQNFSLANAPKTVLEPSKGPEISSNSVLRNVSRGEIDSFQLNNIRSKSEMSEGTLSNQSGINSPICYAKVIDVKSHDPVTHFASSYIVSPKVDKKVHMFDFDDDTEIKIILDQDPGAVTDGELDSFVSEIQRSFTATPVALESISVDDLKPPEFFRSVSRNDDGSDENAQTANNSDEEILLTDIDDTYEEHEIVTAAVFQKKTSSQACTVSKPKLMNRDSACPSNLTLKQKAVSNLEMLSTLSAMSKPPALEQPREPAAQPSLLIENDTSTSSPANQQLLSDSISKESKSVISKSSTYTERTTTNNFLNNTSETSEPTVSSTWKTQSSAKMANASVSYEHSLSSITDINSVIASEAYITNKNASGNTEATSSQQISKECTSSSIASTSQSMLKDLGPNHYMEEKSMENNSIMPLKISSSQDSELVDKTSAAVISAPTQQVRHFPDDVELSHVSEGDGIDSETQGLSNTDSLNGREADGKPSEEFNQPLDTNTPVLPQFSESSIAEIDSVVAHDSNRILYHAEGGVISEEVEKDAFLGKDDQAATDTDAGGISSREVTKVQNIEGSKTDEKGSTNIDGSCDDAAATVVHDDNDGDHESTAADAAPSSISSSKNAPPSTEGGGGTGLVYTAEVKLVQTAGQPKPPASLPSAAPAPAAFVPKPMAPNPVAPAPSALSPAAPAPVATKPVMSPMAGAPPAHSIASQAEIDERRKSMNFNLAANGWGSYNKYYRPISFAS